GRLRGNLLHYTMRSLREHYAKMEVFTTRAAQDLHARGRRRWRGGMYVAAPWTLLQKYVFQLGFLDGYRGALIAWTSARHVWLKYRKLGILVRGGKLEPRSWPQARDFLSSRAPRGNQWCLCRKFGPGEKVVRYFLP